jgi:hypothetical protein
MDPMKTIPIASPTVRPLARLLDPRVHAEILTAAAILYSGEQTVEKFFAR